MAGVKSDTYIKFSDILDFDIDCIDIGSTQVVTKLNGSDMMMRGIVGSLLMGKLGAAVGIGTAQRDSTIIAPEQIKHIYLALNDFKKPSMRLTFYKSDYQMRQVLDYLILIQKRKKA